MHVYPIDSRESAVTHVIGTQAFSRALVRARARMVATDDAFSEVLFSVLRELCRGVGVELVRWGTAQARDPEEAQQCQPCPGCPDCHCPSCPSCELTVPSEDILSWALRALVLVALAINTFLAGICVGRCCGGGVKRGGGPARDDRYLFNAATRSR